MQYERVDQIPEEDVNLLVAEPSGVSYTRLLLYACCGSLIVLKALFVCWLITSSFPLDIFSRLRQRGRLKVFLA